MKRRNAVVVAAAVAALAAAELVVLSSLLASEREGDRARYGEALASQRRDAGKALPAADGDDTGEDDGDATLCVFGVDTFIVAVDEAFEEPLVGEDGTIDLSRLETRSNLATRAARYVEQAAAGPALPQRLGREREDGAWTTLEPPRVTCEGDDATALVRLELPEEPAAPAVTTP